MYILYTHIYPYLYKVYLGSLLRKHPTTRLLRVILQEFAGRQVELGIFREMNGSSPEGVAVEKTAGVNAY